MWMRVRQQLRFGQQVSFVLRLLLTPYFFKSAALEKSPTS
jgi:hypothetical protein